MRTWHEVERSLVQMLVRYNGAEVSPMRGFLWRAEQMVRDGHGDSPCGDLYERMLSQHEERVFRAMGCEVARAAK